MKRLCGPSSAVFLLLSLIGAYFLFWFRFASLLLHFWLRYHILWSFSERILLQRRFAFSSSAANGQSFKKKYSWLEDLGSCRYAISSADFIFDRWHFSSFFSSNFRFDFFFDLLSIFKLPYICYYCFLLLLIPLTCILQVNLYHYYFIQASGMNWNNHYTIIISTNAVSTLRGARSLSFFFFSTVCRGMSNPYLTKLYQRKIHRQNLLVRISMMNWITWLHLKQ